MRYMDRYLVLSLQTRTHSKRVILAWHICAMYVRFLSGIRRFLCSRMRCDTHGEPRCYLCCSVRQEEKNPHLCIPNAARPRNFVEIHGAGFASSCVPVSYQRLWDPHGGYYNYTMACSIFFFAYYHWLRGDESLRCFDLRVEGN